MSRIVLALALFFGSASAGLPSLSGIVPDGLLNNCRLSTTVNVKDTKLNGLSGLNLGGNFETDVNDDLTVGADYDYNECENTPHEVYARWSGNQGGGKVGVLARFNLNKKSTTAELSYSNSDTSLEAKIDSANSNVVEEVSASHKLSAAGHALTLAPKYETDGGKATLRTRFELNDDTHLELEGDVSAPRSSLLRVSHRINANNAVTPELNLESGHMNYEYERSLGEGNSLTANINPNENIELSWKDSGARGTWTTKVNVPWGNAKDADVSFKRNFNL